MDSSDGLLALDVLSFTPAISTAHADDKPTLLMSIWCTCYAITIIIFRVGGRWVRTEQIFIEDTVMLFGILILVARMVLVRYILDFGTNNVEASSLTDLDISHRVIGSQLVLVTRILYAAFLWVIKLSSSIFLANLTHQFWASKSLTSNTSGGRFINTLLSKHLNGFLYGFLLISFGAVCIIELVECRPFTHYWQVVPDPGASCRQAYGQLFTMGILSILTDFALIIFPLPMILGAKTLPRKTRYEFILLLCFPLFSILFTLYRLPNTIEPAHYGAQPYRTLMASLDILIATAASNALVVTSFLQGRGIKKRKYKYQPECPVNQEDTLDLSGGSGGIELGYLTTSNMNSSGSERKNAAYSTRKKKNGNQDDMLKRRWGSDEDLMRDDSDDIGGQRHSATQSTRTTSASEIIVETEIIISDNGRMDVDSDVEQGVARPSNTSHLSPHGQGETSIGAGQPSAMFSSEDDETIGNYSVDDLTRPNPVHRKGYSKVIVVETTWDVDVRPRSPVVPK